MKDGWDLRDRSRVVVSGLREAPSKAVEANTAWLDLKNLACGPCWKRGMFRRRVDDNAGQRL